MPQCLLPYQIGEIDSSGFAQRMPAPRPEVYIQNLVFAISRIKFKLYLSHSIVTNTFQESPPSFFHDGLADCLYEGTSVAELPWVLSSSLGHQRCVHATLLASRTEGKLIFSTSRNALLDKNLGRRNESAHLSI